MRIENAEWGGRPEVDIQELHPPPPPADSLGDDWWGPGQN